MDKPQRIVIDCSTGHTHAVDFTEAEIREADKREKARIAQDKIERGAA